MAPVFYKVILLLIALPAFLCLVHDGYRYTQKPEEGFKLRATGFFWVQYHPDSFQLASETIEPMTWRNINKILIIPGVYIFGTFSLLLYALLGLGGMFFSKPKDMAEFDKLDFLRAGGKKGGYSYKRRR